MRGPSDCLDEVAARLKFDKIFTTGMLVITIYAAEIGPSQLGG